MTRSPPISTYDEDFFTWTQEQAAALRSMPPERVDVQVDIAHVAEEIEDLGKRDLREVRSCLARLLEHLIKTDHAPGSRDAPHWRGEAVNFQVSALEAYSHGMRQLLDIGAVWHLTGRRIDAAVASGLPVRMTATCPFEVDELLVDDFDLDLALATLAAARPDDTTSGAADL